MEGLSSSQNDYPITCMLSSTEIVCYLNDYIIIAQLKLKVGDQTVCTRAELKVLKGMIDTLRTISDEAIPNVFASRNGRPIENIFRRSWLANNVVCSLPTGALAVLNSLNVYRGNFSKDNC